MGDDEAVCRLPDKTILVVEYKGADRYAAPPGWTVT
jgi:hypothetical protein